MTAARPAASDTVAKSFFIWVFLFFDFHHPLAGEMVMNGAIATHNFLNAMRHSVMRGGLRWVPTDQRPAPARTSLPPSPCSILAVAARQIIANERVRVGP